MYDNCVTRYAVVRQPSPSPSWELANIVRHPEMPENGFSSVEEADAWMHDRLLAPRTWRVYPFPAEPT